MPEAAHQYHYNSVWTLDGAITEAITRIGKNPRALNQDETFYIRQSAHLQLLESSIDNAPLWFRKKFMFSFISNQTTYTFPDYVIGIADLVLTAPLRLNTGGVAQSSAGGNPGNCFNPNITAGCIQNAPDGNISYIYPTSQSINYVGVSSLTPTEYTLAIDYTIDGSFWETSVLNPTTLYAPGQTIWTVLETNPAALAWRIRETNGATLQIQQIYFEQANPGSQNPTFGGYADRPINPISQNIYMNTPYKNAAGNVNVYYFNQINPPTMTVWFSPNSSAYTNILGVANCLPHSPDDLMARLDVPPYVVDAFISGLARRLAMKFNRGLVGVMRDEYADAKTLLAKVSYQKVPITVTRGDWR